MEGGKAFLMDLGIWLKLFLGIMLKFSVVLSVMHIRYGKREMD